MNDEQKRGIEYLRTENQVLREKLGNKRILLNDDQRRRLAVKGKVLGRKLLPRLKDEVHDCTGRAVWPSVPWLDHARNRLTMGWFDSPQVQL